MLRFYPLLLLLPVAAPTLAADAIVPGDHTRTIQVSDLERSYLVHTPEKYDPKRPIAVVLVFHEAGTNAQTMVPFCEMSKKSDEVGFIAVYPNGTGAAGIFLTWNAGGLRGKMAERKADDVKFVGSLLDDLATVVNVDPKRVYATGMSNGGMMCYRLAAELSDRIAAIAPVAGTMAIAEAKPNRPVPVMHIHGTADRIVPFGGPRQGSPKFLSFKSVEETVEIWAKLNECKEEPVVEKLEDKAEDGTTVTKMTFSPKEDGADVILVEIEGGGHTWPGVEPPVRFIGKSTKDISAKRETNSCTAVSSNGIASSGSAQSRSSICQYSTWSSQSGNCALINGRCSASLTTTIRSDCERPTSLSCRGRRLLPLSGMSRSFRASTAWREIGPISPQKSTSNPQESAFQGRSTCGASQLNRCSAKRLR